MFNCADIHTLLGIAQSLPKLIPPNPNLNPKISKAQLLIWTLQTVAGVAVAGAIGAAAYLDGKYALRKDILALNRQKVIAKLYAEAGTFESPDPRL